MTRPIDIEHEQRLASQFEQGDQFDLVLNEFEAQERYLAEVILGAVVHARIVLSKHRHNPEMLMSEWSKAQDQILLMSECWATYRVRSTCAILGKILRAAGQ